MDNPLIDIIVTVWNRPVETRNCLVNLINHSPAARFILVNNGSDRETERLLEEFAEILDQRAVLLHNIVNQGYVRAVNKGLTHAKAPYVAIVSNTSTVTGCWLESLIGLSRERNEAEPREKDPMEEFEKEGQRLDLCFNGMQERINDQPSVALFTDKETKSTFGVEPGQSVRSKLRETRERFRPL